MRGASRLRLHHAQAGVFLGDCAGIAWWALRDRPSVDVVLRRLRRILYDGSPVLLPIYGTYDHFTVVAGYTPQRLRLFDSAGMHWIAINHTTFAEQATTRHRTPISSICAILDDW